MTCGSIDVEDGGGVRRNQQGRNERRDRCIGTASRTQATSAIRAAPMLVTVAMLVGAVIVQDGMRRHHMNRVRIGDTGVAALTGDAITAVRDAGRLGASGRRQSHCRRRPNCSNQCHNQNGQQ